MSVYTKVRSIEELDKYYPDNDEVIAKRVELTSILTEISCAYRDKITLRLNHFTYKNGELSFPFVVRIKWTPDNKVFQSLVKALRKDFFLDVMDVFGFKKTDVHCETLKIMRIYGTFRAERKQGCIWLEEFEFMTPKDDVDHLFKNLCTLDENPRELFKFCNLNNLQEWQNVRTKVTDMTGNPLYIPQNFSDTQFQSQIPLYFQTQENFASSLPSSSDEESIADSFTDAKLVNEIRRQKEERGIENRHGDILTANAFDLSQQSQDVIFDRLANFDTDMPISIKGFLAGVSTYSPFIGRPYQADKVDLVFPLKFFITTDPHLPWVNPTNSLEVCVTSLQALCELLNISNSSKIEKKLGELKQDKYKQLLSFSIVKRIIKLNRFESSCWFFQNNHTIDSWCP